MSHSYARLMADAAFHALNARRSLEQAQAKAPEEMRERMDRAIAGAEQLRRWARSAAVAGARRGGLRT